MEIILFILNKCKKLYTIKIDVCTLNVVSFFKNYLHVLIFRINCLILVYFTCIFKIIMNNFNILPPPPSPTKILTMPLIEKVCKCKG